MSVITKRMSAKRGSNLQPQDPVKRTELKAWSTCGHAWLVPLSTTQLIMFQCIRNRLWNRPINTCLSFHYLLEHCLQQWFFFSPQFKRYYLRFIKFSCERVNYAFVKLSVKYFQRLLNYVINKKNNLSFDVNVKMRQVV